MITSQAEYIASERKRYKALDKARVRYYRAAHDLGLHPLDRLQIADRLRELDAMEREL